MAGSTVIIISYQLGASVSKIGSGGANMNIPQTPNSAEERKRMARLDVARRVYQALVAQDPNRVIILCTSTGKVLARHDLRHEQSDPELAS
jgi:hypothetical protein